MRFIGIILILAGLFYAFGKPFLGWQSTGEQVANTVFFDRSKSSGENAGWQVSSVFLENDSNPLIIRIKLSLEGRKNETDEPLKLLVRVAPIAQNGSTLPAVLNQPVTIDLANGNSVSTKEFAIEQTGQFKIGAFPIAADNVTIGRPDLEVDRNILSIEAAILGHARVGGSSGWLMGIGLVVLGIIMLSIFRRGRKQPADNELEREFEEEDRDSQESDAEIQTSGSPPENVEPEVRQEPPPPSKRKTDVGKSIQWGRDADED
ncbi:MAG: hypothetical protein GY761_08695 [Hyphomicrobiales bacterium]|nr:hypothetical protein [Hyphomicrobiales bacterium]